MPVSSTTIMSVVNAPPVREPLVGLIAALRGTPYLIEAETESVTDVAPGAPALRAPGSAPQRWETGVEYLPEQYCYNAGATDPCNPDTRTPPANPATVKANAILVWAGDTCSTFGWQAHDFKGRAERALLGVMSEQISHELWTGRQTQASFWPNPYLACGSANVEVLNSSAVDPGPALALLEQGIAETSNGQQAMIHCTRQLGSALSELGNTFKSLNGTIQTYMGTIINADTGNPGTSPDQVKPTGGVGWAYATLMPTVRLSEIVVLPDTYEEAADQLHNNLTWFTQREATVDFPPCTLIAVKVNLPTPTGVTIGS